MTLFSYYYENKYRLYSYKYRLYKNKAYINNLYFVLNYIY